MYDVFKILLFLEKAHDPYERIILTIFLIEGIFLRQ